MSSGRLCPGKAGLVGTGVAYNTGRSFRQVEASNDSRSLSVVRELQRNDTLVFV
jgi:hypothetical protein